MARLNDPGLENGESKNRMKTKTPRMRTIAAVTSLALMIPIFSGCSFPYRPSEDGSPSPESTTIETPNQPKTPSPGSSTKTASPNPTQTPTSTPSSEVVYWYESNLPESIKPTYNEVVRGIENFETNIPITQDNITKDDASLIYNTIFAEHPTWFYLSLTYTTSISSETDKVKAISPKYSMDRGEWLDKLNKVNAIVDPLVNKIYADYKTEYDRELAAHDWLVKNVTYYNNPSLSGGSASYQTIYGAFVEGKANCMGYARAMMYLMRRLGISAMVVQGMGYDRNGDSEAHEWNMVRIDGQWWQVDVCWDDPEMNEDTAARMGNDIQHGYMNLTDAEMGRDHKVEKVNLIGDPPSSGKDSSGVNYYHRNGLLVSSLDQYRKLVSDNLSQMVDDGTPLDVQFSDDVVFKQCTDKQTLAKLMEDVATRAGMNSWNWSISVAPEVRVSILTVSR